MSWCAGGIVHPTQHNSTRVSYRSRGTQRTAPGDTTTAPTAPTETKSNMLLSARVAGCRTEWSWGGPRLVRTWNVNNEQKLMIFPRRRGTMCCPAACESSHTDLRFTFRTCACQYR